MNLRVENQILHNKQALILHTLNNIPYYVQSFVGASAIDPQAAMVWGTPDALLRVYFGNTN